MILLLRTRNITAPSLSLSLSRPTPPTQGAAGNYRKNARQSVSVRHKTKKIGSERCTISNLSRGAPVVFRKTKARTW